MTQRGPFGAQATRLAAAWSGRAALGPGWALFAGHAGDNRVHRHPALQLAVGSGNSVQAEVAGRRVESAGLLIGAQVPHALLPGPVWLLYVERESTFGRQLAEVCPKGVRRLDPDECESLRARWQAPKSESDRVAAIIELVAGRRPLAEEAVASLRRVRAVIASLPLRPSVPWTLDALAAEAALSPSRFAHAFKAQTGMAVRPYLRWLRLARALDAAARGGSLTTAAHDAGFADAAHFNRTMRRHFGITPGAILASLRGS
jgi:AraC-like DNA-binding protein